MEKVIFAYDSDILCGNYDHSDNCVDCDNFWDDCGKIEVWNEYIGKDFQIYFLNNYSNLNKFKDDFKDYEFKGSNSFEELAKYFFNKIANGNSHQLDVYIDKDNNIKVRSVIYNGSFKSDDDICFYNPYGKFYKNRKSQSK